MKNVIRKATAAVVLCLAALSNGYGQSTPTAQSLPYSQNFSSLLHASTTYPAGWQGWAFCNTSSCTSSSFLTGSPIADNSMIANSSASIATGGNHNYNGKIGMLSSGGNHPIIALAINTTGYYNIKIDFDAMTIRNPYDGTTNTRINGLDLQYKTGSISGTWTSVTSLVNGFYQNNTTAQTGSGVTTPQNSQSFSYTLPSACNNQSAVYLRWVQRDISGSGSRASFAVDNISICPSSSTPSVSISITTGSNPACPGDNVGFTASPTNGGTPSYQWKLNGGNVGSNSPTYSNNALVNGDQVSCEMTSTATCLSALTATSNTITMTFNTPPSASPSSNAPICNSSALNLNANASGTGPLSYQWSGTGTFNDNTSATPSVTGAVTGNYTVTVTGACGSTTSSVSVSVQNPVTATPSFSATHTTACPGDIKTFSVNAVANATSYTWYDPNSSGNFTFQTPTTGSSVTIEFLTPSNPSTSGYNLRVSGVNLCGTGPYKGQFLSRLVSVPQLSGPNYACPNQVKTYTVPMAIGNASAYKFYAPAGADIFDGVNTGNPLTTTSLSVDVTFPPAFVSGNVSVSAIGPCEETALRTIAVKAVPTVSNLTGAASVCPPVNETYTATLVTGATAYDWTFPAGTSVINDNFNVQEIGITNAFTGGNICARATYGCGYSPYRCKAIKVNLPSTPGMITGNKAGVCQSSSESYSVPLVSGLGYNWSANNGATVTPSGNTASIDFTTATLYPVLISVYSTNGCGQSVTARTLSVTGAPAKPVSITGTAAPCSTAVEPYCASSYGATSYIWTLPSGTTFNGANNTSCINANIGTTGGKITAKATNGCGTSQAASLTITVPCRLGDNESLSSSSLQLNPNPASGSVLIRYESLADGQVMINLFDMQGRVVLEAGAAVSTGMNDLMIDLKSLSRGIYVLRIQDEYARLVIQ